MSDFEGQYEIWDEFLREWPADRLANMTIDEYTKVGSQDTFTYWIESRLEKLGSIWGGSSFKFGVYSRKDIEEKSNDGTRSYSNSHAWYTWLGATAEEAFEKVRDCVSAIARLSAEGNLDGIEDLQFLGEATKWKIAFHYQNRQKPVVVDVFKKEWLAAFVGGTASQSTAELQKLALTRRPADLGILEFGKQIWEKWSRTNLKIWKLSHGPSEFSPEERQRYLDAKLVIVHGDTLKGQGKKFDNVPVGTLFYLCHGNQSLLLVGQIISKPEPCDKGDGWLQRSYRVLKPAITTGSYKGGKKGWTPNYNSTFKLVGLYDLPEFESNLLEPFFGIDLAELANLAEISSNAGSVDPPPASILSPEEASSSTIKAENPMRKPFNRIYYGPPGTGKTYSLAQLKDEYKKELQGTAVVQRFRFVTFHQSYGYEEFVEGLRPVLDSDVRASDIRYEIRPGIFKELCEDARRYPDQHFAMFIDEINRGNISKIFGEMITLIESDKRAGAEHPTSIILPYSRQEFAVPYNVDIIGTMNTADRSIALLDTALRRRFDFIPMVPDTSDEPDSPLGGLRVTVKEQIINIPMMLAAINQRIEALYDRDHCIGHAYFMELKTESDGDERFAALSRIFRNRIIPLLEEYFFEDWQKIRLVLADNQKPEESMFVAESKNHEQDLARLFGDEDLDDYSTKRRYVVQEAAFKNPASYRLINETLQSNQRQGE